MPIFPLYHHFVLRIVKRIVNYLFAACPMLTASLEEKIWLYECIYRSDVGSENQKCQFSYYTVTFVFDPGQLPCALIPLPTTCFIF